eukprot:CAMPEP_0117807434 /NCGR_PEP_ID=MMETSP0948-20121206/19305_1 /TAXON_ID=44440 /ORGANISM="Chattonella subsalsa, Strain CCMP2191" /LENGTH=391 /DNA_ID=CAMNT_0005642387 /DNA_START=18 /DNA_END=1194 /DNA_ORIENTATION=+
MNAHQSNFQNNNPQCYQQQPNQSSMQMSHQMATGPPFQGAMTPQNSQQSMGSALQQRTYQAGSYINQQPTMNQRMASNQQTGPNIYNQQAMGQGSTRYQQNMGLFHNQSASQSGTNMYQQSPQPVTNGYQQPLQHPMGQPMVHNNPMPNLAYQQQAGNFQIQGFSDGNRNSNSQKSTKPSSKPKRHNRDHFRGPRKKKNSWERAGNKKTALPALHEAAKAGDVPQIQRLLDRLPQGHEAVNQKDYLARTPLHLAANVEDRAAADKMAANVEDRAAAVQIMQMLTSHGADVNLGCNDNHTALFFCARRGCAQGIKLLLDLGADVNAKLTKNSKTPLFHAASKGQLEAVRTLVEAGADINAVATKDYVETTVLKDAKGEAVLEYLKQQQAKLS